MFVIVFMSNTVQVATDVFTVDVHALTRRSISYTQIVLVLKQSIIQADDL